MFLRREDSEVTLGHGDFLRGLEEFETVPSRGQRRTLENDLFRVCLDYVFLSGNHVAFLINSFAECDIHCLISEWSTGRPEGKRQGHRGSSEESRGVVCREEGGR